MTKSQMTEHAGWNIENSYAILPDIFYTKVEPSPVRTPKLVILNQTLSAALGLSESALRSENGVAIFAGNAMPLDSVPLAQAYAGHQFGYFTKLGDGRALLLGEQMTPSGKRFDIQLKGSGRTPYSRQGDGRAALGPMLREYIISEAMHALGIPTTRSLAVVTTGETVLRETFEPGAILTRVASSHIRVGTFEYAANWGTVKDIRLLADYTLQRHFPDFHNSDNRYLYLLSEAVRRQALLVAKWQLVGFVHGVMNTDNMSICGETIDYGPCAFLDAYDPETVFSSIDVQGRYAYGNQPLIAEWNLSRFAESLLPLIDENRPKAIELAQEMINEFPILFKAHWLDGMRAKLGLFNQETQDEALIESLLGIMKKYNSDYTNTFRALTIGGLEEPCIFDTPEFGDWSIQWKQRLQRQQQKRECVLELMRSSNPAVIARNHRVEAALEAAVKHKDYSVMERLLCILSKPYAHSADQDEYATPPEPSAQRYRTFCGT